MLILIFDLDQTFGDLPNLCSAMQAGLIGFPCHDTIIELCVAHSFLYSFPDLVDRVERSDISRRVSFPLSSACFFVTQLLARFGRVMRRPRLSAAIVQLSAKEGRKDGRGRDRKRDPLMIARLLKKKEQQREPKEGRKEGRKEGTSRRVARGRLSTTTKFS